jgi:hypothetical protein
MRWCGLKNSEQAASTRFHILLGARRRQQHGMQERSVKHSVALHHALESGKVSAKPLVERAILGLGRANGHQQGQVRRHKLVDQDEAWLKLDSRTLLRMAGHSSGTVRSSSSIKTSSGIESQRSSSSKGRRAKSAHGAERGLEVGALLLRLLGPAPMLGKNRAWARGHCP